MSTSWTEFLGVWQGRIQPQHHAPFRSDAPGPAVRRTAAAPFELADGDTLLVSVDDGPTQVVTFEEAEFDDIAEAAAPEVVAVLTSQLSGAIVSEDGGQVVLQTEAVGSSASLHIVGGVAASKLGLSTLRTTGTEGTWSFVLGSDASGIVRRMRGGDAVQVTQVCQLAPNRRVRGSGAARVPELPEGYAWELRYTATSPFDDGHPSKSTTLDLTELREVGFTRKFDLLDVGLHTSKLEEIPYNLTVGLHLTGPSDVVEVELPGIYLDFVEVDNPSGDLFLINRFPAPEQVGVVHGLEQIRFSIANTLLDPVSLATTSVYVNDAPVYFEGAFVPPYTGSVDADDLDDVDVVVNIPHDELDSEEPVEIRVVSTDFDETYTYFMADITPPQLVEVRPLSETVLRVSFNEPMLEADALNPENYTFEARTRPAVPIEAVAVTAFSSQVFDVTVNRETTYGATYRLTMNPLVEDDDGNSMDPEHLSVEFIGFRPVAKPGRSFQLWQMLPELNRREDDGDLWNFIASAQDVVDLLLYQVDRWTDILDIDRAPDRFVDAILAQLGNPFTFVDLTTQEKRRLARELVNIYRLKGTAVGIIAAVRFILGVNIEIDPVNERGDYWQIGHGQLGISTRVGPGLGSPLWYSFWIVSEVVLTNTLRERILQIATYMKPAHEHILGIREPGMTPPQHSFWTLGSSELGVNTYVAN